ncbi:hypothetical protein [Erythrobacter sp.]|nr:hypothetical protein [Erythrobacter sp.]QIQ87764.1 MAG: hypothetical protein G9473_14515 [Erythrobacter sp.]
MTNTLSHSLAACAALLLTLGSITAITVVPEPVALSLAAPAGQPMPELA